MSRDKQIEEMANTINEMDEPNAHYYGRNLKQYEAFADCFTIARHLYDKGYRKAEDVAREIFEEIQKSIVHNILHNENYSFEGVMDSITKDLDKLKKKYESEGEG